MATLKMTKRYQVQLGAISGAQLILVGCGGTGSFLALHLARLAYDARERHGLALQLTFVDPDRVEAGNLGRQNFCPAEVGANKALALAWRYSAAFGLPITAHTRAFQPSDVPNWVSVQQPVVLVGAVDNAAARRVLHETCVARGGRVWWLDCGNHDQAGQVLLGCSEEPAPRLHALGYCDRLPLPSMQCPELLVDELRAPVGSCAERVQRAEQFLMVN